MNNKYEEAASQDKSAARSDWEALGRDFSEVGDQVAESMIGADALFGIPAAPEAIKRVKEAQQRRKGAPVKARRPDDFPDSLSVLE